MFYLIKALCTFYFTFKNHTNYYIIHQQHSILYLIIINMIRFLLKSCLKITATNVTRQTPLAYSIITKNKINNLLNTNTFSYSLHNNRQTLVTQILTNYMANRSELNSHKIFQVLLQIRKHASQQDIKNLLKNQSPQFKALIKDIELNFRKTKFTYQYKILIFLKVNNIEPNLCKQLQNSVFKLIQKVDLIKIGIFIKDSLTLNFQEAQIQKVNSRVLQLIQQIEKKKGYIIINNQIAYRQKVGQNQPKLSNESRQKYFSQQKQKINIMSQKQYNFLIKGLSHNIFKNSETLIKLIKLGITQKNMKVFTISCLTDLYTYVGSSLGEQDLILLQEQVTMIFNRILNEHDWNNLENSQLHISFVRKLFQVLGRYCYIFKNKQQHIEKNLQDKNPKVHLQEQENQQLKQLKQQQQQQADQNLFSIGENSENFENSEKKKEMLMKLIQLILKKKSIVIKKIFWASAIQILGRLNIFNYKLWCQILQLSFKTESSIKELQFLSIGFFALHKNNRLLIKDYEQKLWQLIWKQFGSMGQGDRLRFLQVYQISNKREALIKKPDHINIDKQIELLRMRNGSNISRSSKPKYTQTQRQKYKYKYHPRGYKPKEI